MNRSLTNPQPSSVEPKPFLRWAGGKSWLVRSLEKIAANIKFENYHEPFIGGASMFLAMRPQNSAFLSDLNKELIDTYKVVKSDVEELIVELQSYKNTETFYYNIREQDFKNKVQQAAKFIYLNQTSFNGIYRVNLKGVYNVPYGYRKKRFLEPDNLRLVSKRLKKAKLFHGDFELVKPYIKKGDLIFLDPCFA